MGSSRESLNGGNGNASTKKTDKKSDGNDEKYAKVLISPLQPDSPQEIASFATLDLALRSHPELAREGANILNPKALARLVQGIREFQDVHLGRGAKGIKGSEQWPLVRLPDEILRCRSGAGPLFTVILAAYRQKKESSWRQFDFTSPKRYDDNIALLKRIERDLRAAGQLKRPVIYFDETVPEDLRKEYKKIVLRFGGKVVKRPPREPHDTATRQDDRRKRKRRRKHKHTKQKQRQMIDNDTDNTNANDLECDKKDNHEYDESADESEPTHVVAWDGEEHDSPENVEDDRNIREGNGELEKLYLRTMIVVDPRVKKNVVGGGIVESTVPDSKKKGGKSGGKGARGKPALAPLEDPMALVHWWYWPSSYDEWMLACDVAGEGETNPPPRPEGGCWVVGCKFIRDVENFNEWGLEDDYAIVDYTRKVTHYIKLEEKKKAKAQLAKQNVKKAMIEGADQDGANYGESNSGDGTSSRTNIIGSSEGSGNNAGLKSTSAKGNHDRRSDEGINPRRIPTGFLNESGSQIRHTVYDGALTIPSDAVTLMHHAIHRIYQNNGVDNVRIKQHTKSTIKTNNTGNTEATNTTEKTPLTFVNSLLRPSEDPLIASNFIVTELRAGNSGVTTALNRKIFCTPSPSAVLETGMQCDTHRIRGGGELDKELVPDVGQFDDAGEGNGDSEGSVMHSSIHSTRVITTEKIAVKEELSEGRKTQGMDSITNAGDGSATIATTTNFGVESKSRCSETMLDQQMSNINTKLGAKGIELPVVPIPAQSHVNSESDSTNGNANKLEVKIGLEQAPTHDGKSLPNHLSSGSNVVEGNIILPKLAESSNTSSLPNIDSSMTTEALSQKAFIEKKSSNAPGTLSTLKQDDEPCTKRKDFPPTLAPLCEKLNTTSSHKTASETISKNTKSGAPLRGDQEPTIASPCWYNSKLVSDFERSILPEWFDQSAVHRTPSTYLSTREKIIDVARQSGAIYMNSIAKKYLTATAIRRCVPGDAGSLLRLHQFLVTWGFINGSAIGDLAPRVINFTKDFKETKHSALDGSHYDDEDNFVKSRFWSETRDELLIKSVVLSSSRKRKFQDQNGDQIRIDWETVADEVGGGGVTPIECQRRFLSLNLKEVNCNESVESSQDKSNEINASGMNDKLNLTIDKNNAKKENVFHALLDGTCPKVIQAAIDAALRVTGSDIAQARKASILGVISANGLMHAKEEEEAAENILQEILNQRMAKLENRLSILEDVEGIVDAERVSLEIERRDLYTARCRHWFARDT